MQVQDLTRVINAGFLGGSALCLVCRSPAAAQDSGPSDHQQFVEVMQADIASSRVSQTLEAGEELIQRGLPGRSR